MTPAVDVLPQLLALDACAVSDALDSLGLPGAVRGIAPAWPGARLAGRVVTVELVAAADAAGTPPRHLGAAAIDHAQPGDVVVVAHPGGSDGAGWGGLLSLASQRQGLAGTVVDGPCRDVDEARELGYPLFARSATPMTARRRVVERAWNVPVAVGRVAVAPGDWVVADASGVVFVAAGRAAEVVARAEEVARRERAMAEQIRQGHPVSEVLAGRYETLLTELERAGE